LGPLAASLAALLAAGCFEVDYLLQAGEGQLDLACRARSLSSAADDPNLDPHTRRLLAEVPRVKAFGVGAGLVATDNYDDFVELDQKSVVWVVSAAPELSLTPKLWWLPIVGEVTYLGWFDRPMADRHGRALEAEGWDVDVRGSSAYSTLGFFEDPVLSTMLDDSPHAEGELTNIILHESVHATVYVADQPDFNESVATFVGDQLTIAYLRERFGPASSQLASWRAIEASNQKLRDRLHRAYVDLSAVYASPRTADEKRAEKARYLSAVRRELDFPRPITNATLTHYDTYHGSEREMAALLERCGGDLERMIAVVKRLTASDFRRKHDEDLQPLVERLASRCQTLP
jgi:predicted aminopeptidase